ncbi:hypothetical protein [Actinacidiphila acididurans]|uniref:Uncharacterized protein n=1 Tax=Actinacidiphila acididurans TaxID=2784346 RepID=A0ABS2TPQ7_9ACTN|nr:hypothetical protein [Actinacidiphila acididurans]MBM9504817.1 hypothetical protein [Actinacidiphila acididurans]
MNDVTPARELRLAPLFEMHHERLVRALRARLGRYDWDLAEVIAADTWQLAAVRVDGLTAAEAEVFPWLAELARSAQVTRLRASRASARDGSKARAYVLPSLPPVLAAIPLSFEAGVRLVADAVPVTTGVAA